MWFWYNNVNFQSKGISMHGDVSICMVQKSNGMRVREEN